MPKISDLPVPSALNGEETVVIVKDGATAQAPLADCIDATVGPVFTAQDVKIAVGDFLDGAALFSNLGTVAVPAGRFALTTNGYYNPGDQGGGIYTRVGSGPASLTRRQDGGGQWWQLQALGEVRIEQVGGGLGYDSSDTDNVLAACALADRVIVDRDVQCVTQPAPSLYIDATFVGSRSILGLARKWVIPRDAKPAYFSGSDVRPDQLPMLNTATAIKAGIIGDSIGQYAPNRADRVGSLPMFIERGLRQTFPDRPISFFDFAVGGQTWATADDVPIVGAEGLWPYWYTDRTAKWLSYIEAAQLDVLFINFGMNDSWGISLNALRSIIAKIRSWAKVPDIVICTNLVPRPMAGFEDTVESQSGRDFAAGIQRTFARANNIALLDHHRMACMARDGFDPCLSIVHQGGTATSGQGQAIVDAGGGSYTGTKYCSSYRAIVTLNTAALTGGDLMKIKVGAGGNDVLLISRAGTTYTVQFHTGKDDQDWLYDTQTFVLAPDSGSTLTIIMEVKDDLFTLYHITGDYDFGADLPSLITRPLIRHGGFFPPKIDGDSAITAVSMDYSDPALCMPTLTATQLFGDGLNPIGHRMGSGFNHPGDDAGPHIYGPVWDAAHFCDGGMAVEILAREALDARTAGVTPARIDLSGPDRTATMDADALVLALQRLVIGNGADALVDFDQVKSVARFGHKTVEIAGALSLLSPLGLNAESLRSTVGQLIQVPAIRRALAIGDDSGRLGLDVDGVNAVIGSDYTIRARIDPNWYEDARLYPIDYTPTAPVLITDTTNVNYVPRKFQGIPSCVRTGARYWAAWTGDISGIERVGNFVVLAYSDDSCVTWTEYGYVAYDGDLTKAVSISSLWQAPDGALWIAFTTVGNNKWFDGVLGTWVHVLANPESPPIRFNWRTPIRLSRTGATGKITPIDGQYWISQDHWYSQGVSKALYGNRVGKRIHRIYPTERRAEYLFTLPENINAHSYDETMFAQAKDGSILAAYRTPSGLESVRSYNGGATWGEQALMFSAIGANPTSALGSRCWLGASPSGRMVLAYNNATTRSNLTVKLSDDGGRTWPYSAVITAGSASYPWVMFGPAGEIFTVYDVDRAVPGQRRINCAKVLEADLVAGTAVPVITTISYKGDVV